MAVFYGMVGAVMEILTLLKANINKKKGSFISVILLSIIIITSMTAILSVRDNCNNAMKKAFETADSGDMMVYLRAEVLTEDLRHSVENSELVGDVRCFDAICTGGSWVRDNRDGNSQFLMKMRDGILLYNDKLDGFEDSIPELKGGEIYLSLGMKYILSCSVGDTIYYDCPDAVREFTIKGFVQEPSQGAGTIGWKQVFISNEDFEKILVDCKDIDRNKFIVEATMMMIYKADDCTLSDAKFQRQLNLDTKIVANAIGSLTK